MKSGYLKENTQICNESDIVESQIGKGVFMDKYTPVDYSQIEENVRLERNNQIEICLSVYGNYVREKMRG